MRAALLGGRYRLGPVIGEGGMGAVHRARDERSGRDVAVKVLRTGAAATDCARLRREVEYLRAVQHPNLVAVLDAGADGDGRDGRAWFAMELVAGPDLRTLLQQRGPMEGAAVRRLLDGVLGALGAMHAAGLVHRDVTPSNILLSADVFARWEAKLTDLGIAQRALAPHLTDAGRVVGTAAYLSPEQVTGGEVGPPADVYALALVALEALTGDTPFPGSAAESATRRLVRSPALPGDLDAEWRDWLASATALDPADRPSVAALRDAARALPDDAGVRPGRPQPAMSGTTVAMATASMPAPVTSVLAASAPPPRRRSRVAVVAGASALVLAGLGTLGSVALLGGQAVTSAGSAAEPSSAAATPRPTSSASAAPVTDEDTAADTAPLPGAGPGTADASGPQAAAPAAPGGGPQAGAPGAGHAAGPGGTGPAADAAAPAPAPGP